MIFPCKSVAMMAWTTASSSRLWKRICSSALLRTVVSLVLVTSRLPLRHRRWVASAGHSWTYNCNDLSMYLLAEPATKVEVLNSSGPDLDGEQVGRESHT